MLIYRPSDSLQVAALPALDIAASGQALLRGVGQIYLQRSALFGFVVLAGLWFSEPMLAAGCLLGAVAAMVAAALQDYSPDARCDGIYVFNGALSGAGLAAFYEWNAALTAWIVLAGIAGAVGVRAFERARLPAYTSLFVAVMWLAETCAHAGYGLRPLSPSLALTCEGGLPGFVACATGQVSFVADGMGAGMVAAALALTTAGRGAIGIAAVASLMAHTAGIAPGVATSMGINGMLVMLALGARGYPCTERIAACAFGMALSAVVPFFTLPFVLATWAALALRRL